MNFDHVEDLARGYAYGSRRGAEEYKLNEEERQLYELAKTDGYLSTRSRRPNLENTYFAWCRVARRPFVGIRFRRRWASVRVDMDPTGRLLGEGISDLIFTEFQRHGALGNLKGGDATCTGGAGGVWVDGIDEGAAASMARFMWQVSTTRDFDAGVVMNREPVVKFFQDAESVGAARFATLTVAVEPDAFLRAVSSELPGVLAHALGNDQIWMLDAVLPQICDIWAKLRGYKAEGVFEERRLIAGQPHPEGHMECLNAGLTVDAADIDGKVLERMHANGHQVSDA